MMLDHARSNGVEVHEEVGIEKVIFEDECAVGVQILSQDGAHADVAARVVVDASGRACVIGRQLGLRSPLPELRKASAWGYFRGGKRLPGIDAAKPPCSSSQAAAGSGTSHCPTTSSALASSPTRNMCSPRVMTWKPRSPAQLQNAFRCPNACGTPHGPVPCAARVIWPTSTAGPAAMGWVMIGDARAFLDPIYSSGLYLALGSAELAAQCIDDALKNCDQGHECLHRRTGANDAAAATAGLEPIESVGSVESFR
jgi:2-polyprenyl-6-methoxyphenol hydroxylase-like FAD-dependent oxidoreductase